MADLPLCVNDAWSGIGGDCRIASPVENRERITGDVLHDANSGDGDDGLVECLLILLTLRRGPIADLRELTLGDLEIAERLAQAGDSNTPGYQ